MLWQIARRDACATTKECCRARGRDYFFNERTGSFIVPYASSRKSRLISWYASDRVPCSNRQEQSAHWHRTCDALTEHPTKAPIPHRHTDVAARVCDICCRQKIRNVAGSTSSTRMTYIARELCCIEYLLEVDLQAVLQASTGSAFVLVVVGESRRGLQNKQQHQKQYKDENENRNAAARPFVFSNLSAELDTWESG